MKLATTKKRVLTKLQKSPQGATTLYRKRESKAAEALQKEGVLVYVKAACLSRYSVPRGVATLVSI